MNGRSARLAHGMMSTSLIRTARFLSILPFTLALGSCTRAHETTAKPTAPEAPPAASAAPFQVLPSPALARAGQSGNATIADVVERDRKSVV